MYLHRKLGHLLNDREKKSFLNFIIQLEFTRIHIHSKLYRIKVITSEVQNKTQTLGV